VAWLNKVDLGCGALTAGYEVSTDLSWGEEKEKKKSYRGKNRLMGEKNKGSGGGALEEAMWSSYEGRGSMLERGVS